MYSKEQQPDPSMNAESVTEMSMNAIYDILIEPMESKLSVEDSALIGVIGTTLKLVAQKAKAYEDMMQGKGDFSHHSRN